MHYDNGFELLIAFFFNMNPQIRGLVPKAQDLVIPFCRGEVEYLPDFHLGSIAIKSELILIIYQTGHINNLTERYITEMSELKHLQSYMNSFELDFRGF